MISLSKSSITEIEQKAERRVFKKKKLNIFYTL